MGGREGDRGREGDGGVTSPRVLTALQQLIRFAAVRNTNDVPCRNLSAADLSFVAHIAHSLARPVALHGKYCQRSTSSARLTACR